MQSTFFCFGKFLKWLADDQCSSTTKGSVYYIKHMHMQPCSMEVNWQEIWHQMDVSTTFYICTYWVFTLWGRNDYMYNNRISFYWSHELFHWVVFSIKSHCLRLNPMRTMTKLSTFSHDSSGKLRQSLAGRAGISNTENCFM